MPNKSPLLFPKDQRKLTELGENIKLARLRRRLSSEQVADRANIGRSTLIKIEQGHPGVSMGNVFNVLKVFRLEDDFLLLAKDDILGRKIQDAGLIVKRRAPKRKSKKP